MLICVFFFIDKCNLFLGFDGFVWILPKRFENSTGGFSIAIFIASHLASRNKSIKNLILNHIFALLACTLLFFSSSLWLSTVTVEEKWHVSSTQLKCNVHFESIEMYQVVVHQKTCVLLITLMALYFSLQTSIAWCVCAISLNYLFTFSSSQFFFFVRYFKFPIYYGEPFVWKMNGKMFWEWQWQCTWHWKKKVEMSRRNIRNVKR